MMKKVMLLMMMLFPLVAMAQSSELKVVESIFGVRLGYEFKAVQKSLKKSLGKPANETKNENICYANVMYEGIKFSSVEFSFENYLGVIYRLKNVSLFVTGISDADATDFLGRINDKYGVVSHGGDDDFQAYSGGISTNNSNKYGFMLSFSKKDGFYGISLLFF